MYFKRPSFRRGGSTGIGQLTPRVKAQSGYFGQTPIYPIPLNQIRASAAMGMGDGTIPMMKSFPMDAQVMRANSNIAPIEKIKDSTTYGFGYGIDGDMMDVEGPSAEEIFARMYNTVTTKIQKGKFLNTEERKFANDNDIKMYNEIQSGDTQTTLDEIIDKNKTGIEAISAGGDQITVATDAEKAARTKALLEGVEEDIKTIEPGSDDSSITLDPYEEIKKEKDFLSEMLKNEGLERGEIALIAAKAIGTEGSFKDKLDAAVELALPVVRRRNKEDKALTLTAYKSFKEKEKAKAKTTADANKPTNEMRNLENRANILIKNGDKRDKETIKAEFISNALDESPDIKSQRLIIKQYLPEIDERHGNVVTYRAELEKYKSDYKGKDITKDKKYMRLIQKVSEAESLFGTFIDDKGILLDMIPQYREVIESLSKIKFKDGGRIGYAMGTNPNETSEDIESTEVITTGGTETQEKPVLNLTYAELRDRLPPEITDQVVSLLASSEQALQDFAYITSQEDVQNFNVKYGVNLVIPPAQQTA
jgi:hypothetical protein